MSLFDTYFCIDWSARNSRSPQRESADALWLGERTTDSAATEKYHRSREECMEDLKARLLRHAAAGRRVLVGFDFPFGYPAGLAAALELEGPEAPWLRFWRELGSRISDNARNESNRFAVAGELNERCRTPGSDPSCGPFWGCPHGRTVPGLSARSPGFPYSGKPGHALTRLRVVDRRCPGVQEGWKLFGAGSVGSQALLGIPRVLRLREDPELGAISRVWPFETASDGPAFAGSGPRIVYAEVWPSRIYPRHDDTDEPPDRAQVRAVAAWMAEEDAREKLEGWLQLPEDLSPAERTAVIAEEGWILGAG